METDVLLSQTPTANNSTQEIGDVALREADSETVQSPFLEDTLIQFAWDSTSLGALKTCPRYYQYTIIEGWQAKSEAIHLRFGLEYHQALHDYELAKVAGYDHNGATKECVRLLLLRIHSWNPEPNTKSEELKSKENLLRTIIWYLDQFEDDPAQTVILDDGKPAIELSFRFELDWGPMSEVDVNTPQPYLLCGHLDRVVTFHDELYDMDRKTTTSTPGSYYFNQFEPHNQMTLYSVASQVVLSSPIKGVIIDAAQIAVGFSRFTRGFTYRTETQLQEWLGDLKFWLAQAEDFAAEGYWPMNDTACDKFGGCRFRGICSKAPQVRQQFLKSNFIQLAQEDRWNPLKPR